MTWCINRNTQKRLLNDRAPFSKSLFVFTERCMHWNHQCSWLGFLQGPSMITCRQMFYTFVRFFFWRRLSIWFRIWKWSTCVLESRCCFCLVVFDELPEVVEAQKDSCIWPQEIQHQEEQLDPKRLMHVLFSQHIDSYWKIPVRQIRSPLY